MKILDPREMTAEQVCHFLMNADVKICDYDPEMPDYVYNSLKLSTLAKTMYYGDFDFYFKSAPDDYLENLTRTHPHLLPPTEDPESLEDLLKDYAEDEIENVMQFDATRLATNISKWGICVITNFIDLIESGTYLACVVDKDDGTYYFNIKVKTH